MTTSKNKLEKYGPNMKDERLTGFDNDGKVY
jgi:hypothetical protein